MNEVTPRMVLRSRDRIALHPRFVAEVVSILRGVRDLNRVVEVVHWLADDPRGGRYSSEVPPHGFAYFMDGIPEALRRVMEDSTTLVCQRFWDEFEREPATGTASSSRSSGTTDPAALTNRKEGP